MRLFKSFFVSIFVLVALTAVSAAQTCGDQDYKCKIATATRQIAANGNDTEAYYARGAAFRAQGQLDQAINDFSRYIALKPENKVYLADGYSERGVCYKQKGDFVKAISDYTDAIKLVPGQALYLFNRGNAYSAGSQFDLAIADFTAALKLKPSYSEALVGRGHAYMKKSDPERALADFNGAILINPSEAEAYYNSGVILGNRKDYNGAIRAYDKYIELNTNNLAYLADGYQYRGLAFYDLGDNEKALKDLTAAIDLNPKKAEIYRSRAAVYRSLGKKAFADADEKKADSLPK